MSFFLLSSFRSISDTPVLSKVYEWVVSSRLCAFMKTDVFPMHQHDYRKGLGTCDVMLNMVCAVQAALDRSRESAAVQIDFSAAFDSVSHSELLFQYLLQMSLS